MCVFNKEDIRRIHRAFGHSPKKLVYSLLSSLLYTTPTVRCDLYGRRFGSKYSFRVTCHDFFVAGDEKTYFPPKFQTLRGEFVSPQNPLVLYRNRYTAAVRVRAVLRLPRRLLRVAAVAPRRAVTPGSGM